MSAAKIVQHVIQRLAVADRFGKTALDQRHILRNHRQQRFGHTACQLVHPDQGIGGRTSPVAEAALDGIPALSVILHTGHLAQRLEAETAQHGQHVFIQPERRHRQIGKPVSYVFSGRQNTTGQPRIGAPVM